MFTGIVEEVGKVISSRPGKLQVAAAKTLAGLQIGGSMAVNGVCLTVTAFDAISFAVDVMEETLRRSNLGLLKAGDPVNLERPLKYGGEVGGHLVQGHVDTTAKIDSIVPDGAALRVRFAAPPEIMRYIAEKGFIAVDGISLTVAERETGSFAVSVVSYTRNNTTLSTRKTGDTVNLEADMMAKYVELYQQQARGGITMKMLSENGF